MGNVETAKQKHIHKFKMHKYKSGTTTFFCTLPDCTVKINPALAVGKRSICWRCGSDFILSEYAIRLVKPHCENCHQSKDSKVKINGKKLDDNESFVGTVIETIIYDEEKPMPPMLSLAEQLKQATQPKTIEDEDI